MIFLFLSTAKMSNGDAGGGGNQESGHDNKNLIVNYLPQALTDIEFRNMFSTVGAIKKCRIMRNMQVNLNRILCKCSFYVALYL